MGNETCGGCAHCVKRTLVRAPFDSSEKHVCTAWACPVQEGYSGTLMPCLGRDFSPRTVSEELQGIIDGTKTFLATVDGYGGYSYQTVKAVEHGDFEEAMRRAYGAGELEGWKKAYGWIRVLTAENEALKAANGAGSPGTCSRVAIFNANGEPSCSVCFKELAMSDSYCRSCGCKVEEE